MDENLMELAKKLYDYIKHDKAGINNDWEHYYLTENIGKDGKKYLWYMDENVNIAICEESEKIIDSKKLNNLFNF